MRFLKPLACLIAVPVVLLLAGCTSNSTDPVKSDSAPSGASASGTQTVPGASGAPKGQAQTAPPPTTTQ